MAELTWRGNMAAEILKRAAVGKLLVCAADLQGKSAQRAPVDTGDLRANCSVSPLKEELGGAAVTVGYDLPYAIVQHESLGFHHPKGGESKFLENPYNENKDRYVREIGQAVEAAIKSAR